MYILHRHVHHTQEWCSTEHTDAMYADQ